MGKGERRAQNVGTWERADKGPRKDGSRVALTRPSTAIQHTYNGKRTVNVEPFPSSLATMIVPPC